MHPLSIRVTAIGLLVVMLLSTASCARRTPVNADPTASADSKPDRMTAWAGATASSRSTETPRRLGLPCTDSLYVALKAKPLDAMSSREYEYFIEKDRLCSQSIVSPSAERVAQSIDRYYDLEIAGAIVAVVLGIIYATSY